MKRTFLLATGAIAWCFASACGGALTGDDDSSDSAKGAIGASGKGTAESANDEATSDGKKQTDSKGGTLDPCTDTKPGDPGKPGDLGPNKPGEKPSTCFTFNAGEVCADPGDAKLAAVKICASKGYIAVGLAIDSKGGCSVTCCDDGASAPPPPPPEPCTWTVVGDEKVCVKTDGKN